MSKSRNANSSKKEQGDTAGININCDELYEYLIKVYFPNDDENGKPQADRYLDACIKRAYLDFSRTLHGISKVDDKDNIYKICTERLKVLLSDVKNTNNQEKFDKLHKSCSEELKSVYNDNGYNDFRIGQSQKWINMTLKYIIVMGESRVSGFSDAYKYFHVPIDNILLYEIKKIPVNDKLHFSGKWSRIDDYEVYMYIQKWIRKNFENQTPIEAEFKLWLGKEITI